MKTAFKKITIFFIIFLLLLPQIPLNEKERVSAQTEEFKISCETEIPVGEAIDWTEDLTKKLTEDLDFMVVAFLQQEHAVKRIHKLSQGAGGLIDWWGLAEGLIPYLSEIAEVYGWAKCAWAAVKITESTIELSNAVNKIYMGSEGVKDFKTAYVDIKDAISDAGNVFSQGFNNVRDGVSDIKKGIEDIKDAGKTIKENYKDIEKIKTGYQQIDNGEIIPGLMNLITGIRALDKVILAIRTIDKSLGLINGAVQKVLIEVTDEGVELWGWQCAEPGKWYCSYIGGILGPYETEAECQRVSTMGTGCTCSQPLKDEEKQTGLCLIQAQLESIEGVLNLIPKLRESLEKIRDGIDGILELVPALENIDKNYNDLPEVCREKLPSELVSALDTAIEIKEKIEPVIEGIIEVIDIPLEQTRDLTNGAVEVLLTLEEKIGGETQENYLSKASEAIKELINDTRNIIESIRKGIPKIPTVNELFWGVLKGIKEKIKDLFASDEKKEVGKQIDEILEKDEYLGSDDASTSTNVTGDTKNLDDNAASTHSAAEDNKKDLETGNNRLEGTFNLLDTEIENQLSDLGEYFEEISIISMFNLETLLDLTGLNQCNCKRCVWCSPCFVVDAVEIPGICWGVACPYGEIKIYVNSIGALQSGDWGFAPENVYYWLNGQKKGRLTSMKQAWEELSDLIYTRENRIWREGEPEELSLGNLTKAEFYLIIKELAGKELEDCFVTTKMFEKGESLKYLFSCENALKENLIPQSEYEPGTEGWKQTIEGRCYLYPNNFVCCQ